MSGAAFLNKAFSRQRGGRGARTTIRQPPTPSGGARTEEKTADKPALQRQFDVLVNHRKQGPKPKANDSVSVRRRVTRPNGLARRLATFFEDMISFQNQRLVTTTGFHGMLSTADVIKHLPVHGTPVDGSHDAAMSRVLMEQINTSGPVARGYTAGLMAQHGLDDKQSITTTKVAELTNLSPRHVRRCRERADRGYHGPIASMMRVEGEERKSVPDTERWATDHYVHKECPARSGDKVEIAWFTKTADDFYYENYRTRDGQVKIMETAMEHDRLQGNGALRAAAGHPKNQWERNIRIFLGEFYCDAFRLLSYLP